jgi:hypothetical protein
LRHYATSWKVAGFETDEVNELGPAVYLVCSRNEDQKQKKNVSGEYSAAGV